MGKYIIEVSDEAKRHLAAIYKSGDRKSIKRVERIFEELSESPYVGIGQPEALKHNLSGLWSRQINEKDRIVYSVEEENVIVNVIAAKGHYGQK